LADLSLGAYVAAVEDPARCAASQIGHLPGMTDEAVPKKTRVYCNTCRQETNHEVKGEHTTSSHDESADFGETRSYRLLVCMGCEHGVLQYEYSNSEMFQWDGADDTYEQFSDISYFPERSQHSLAPKTYAKLKPTHWQLYTRKQ